MAVPKFVKQTVVLIGSQILVVVAGFVIKPLQTNHLSPQTYGYFATFMSLTGFAVLFYRFGFFTSLQYLLSKKENESREPALVTAGWLLALVIGLLFSITLWGFSFGVDGWFNVKIGSYLRWFAPLLLALPYRHFISAYAIGTNRTSILAIFDSGIKILFLALLLGLLLFDAFSLATVIATNLISINALLIWTSFKLPIRPGLWKNGFLQLWKTNKSYGINMYAGFIANQSTFKVDELLIASLVSSLQNGFYTLASLLCSPIVMFSQNLSNVLFKRFSNSAQIPFITFLLIGSASIAYIVILIVGGGYIVERLFGEEYLAVNDYLLPLALAFFFKSMYQPFMFLASKGQGKTIRNIAFIEAAINLGGNLALIPIFGVYGAIYTSMVAKAVHLLLKLLAYRNYLKSAQ